MWRRDPTACSMGSLWETWKGGGGEGCTPAHELRLTFRGKANMAFAEKSHLEGWELNSR